MIVSVLLIFAIAAGGFGVTYLISARETLLWRIAAGCIIGSAMFGTLGFFLASIFGLSTVVVVVALALTISPIIVFRSHRIKKIYDGDRSRARGRTQGASAAKALRLAYYVFFFFLFLFFFDRAMIVTDSGIFTGGSNNLGDLPFHLGAIYSFLETASFPPDNPNFAGVKFTYPFVADLITAMFVTLGASIRDAMFVQNMAWALSLLVVLETTVFKLIGDRLASKLASFLLFFSGGLGFIWFLSDQMEQGRGLIEFIRNLPKDYTIGEDFRWGNSLTTLFLTQRSLLLGMPAALICIGVIWNAFSRKTTLETGDRWERLRPFFLIGLIAGTLPLIHIHSLIVLFILGVFVLVVKRELWREWSAFAVGAALVGLPLLIWTMTDSATRTSEFIGIHFGWDMRDDNFLWFWIKNTGLLFPLLVAGIYLVWTAKKPEVLESEDTKKRKKPSRKEREAEASRIKADKTLLIFAIPFMLLFVLANVVKLAPWEWDNIKILIYWYVFSIPFIALVMSWAWKKGGVWSALTAVSFLVMTMSGMIDVWRTVSGHVNYQVFNQDAVTLADRLRASTRPESVFLNAPTYNSTIVLTGRSSVMRYPGHLGSHGIDYEQRQDDVKAIYRGGPEAETLMERYGVTHVLISPEERNSVMPNEQFFARYPVIADSGQSRVHKIE